MKRCLQLLIISIILLASGRDAMFVQQVSASNFILSNYSRPAKNLVNKLNTNF